MLTAPPLPDYVSRLILWVHRDGFHALPLGHAAVSELLDLRRLLDPSAFATTHAERVDARLREARLSARTVDELRLGYARRWARLYAAHTGAPCDDLAGALHPLLDAVGRPVFQLALDLA